MPKVSYFCQSANIPPLDLGTCYPTHSFDRRTPPRRPSNLWAVVHPIQSLRRHVQLHGTLHMALWVGSSPVESAIRRLHCLTVLPISADRRSFPRDRNFLTALCWYWMPTTMRSLSSILPISSPRRFRAWILTFLRARRRPLLPRPPSRFCIMWLLAS